MYYTIRSSNFPFFGTLRKQEEAQGRQQRTHAFWKAINALPYTDIQEAKYVYEATLVGVGDMVVHNAQKGPLGTHELRNCIAVGAKGIDGEGKLYIGLAHVTASELLRTGARGILARMRAEFERQGVPPDSVRFLQAGGLRGLSADLQEAVFYEDPNAWDGARLNIRDPHVDYESALDVVMDQEAKMWFGDNNRVFIDKKSS